MATSASASASAATATATATVTQKGDIGCCLPATTSRTTVPLVQARTVQPGDRRAYAARRIKAGEVILRNAPLAHSVHGNNIDDHCANCFQSSNNNQQQNKLSQCGRCKVTKYCSRKCQAQDFPSHKVECPAFHDYSVASMLDDEARLLVRTYLALHPTKEDDSKRKQCTLISQSNDDDASQQPPAICSCGVEHFENLASSQHSLDASDRLAIQSATGALLAHLTKQAKKKKNDDSNTSTQHHQLGLLPSDKQDMGRLLETYLRIFRVNNFGIVDSMQRVIGGGVYPLGALLNHSCSPNCVLRYTNFKSEAAGPPVLEIVAAREISQGEELTHSYVELVAHTTVRQSRLFQSHGFTCSCPRCRGDANCCTIQLPTIIDKNNQQGVEPQAVLLTKWILNKGLHKYCKNTEAEDDEATLVSVKLENCLKTSVATAGRSSATRQRDLAKRYMAEGDVERELHCLDLAVQALLSSSSSSASQQQDELISELVSMDLYEARGELLGTLIVAGETIKALNECEHVVAFLCIAFWTCQVPNHPLLGLQLFTLGDLYEATGNSRRAQATYAWARETLAICQGPTSDMVQLLNDKLR